MSERSVALLDCVEARSEAVPSDFIKIVQILESEPYLESVATQLVHSYCESNQHYNYMIATELRRVIATVSTKLLISSSY